MDTKSFLKEIRSIIREEIEYALNKEKQNESKQLNLEALKHGLELYKKTTSKPQQQVKQQQKKSTPKTNSGLSIQSILEETRRSIQENYEDEDFPEMRFSSNMVHGNVSHNMGVIPSGVNPEDITPEVSKALTRDYSALMAKINEKKGA